MPQLSLMKLFGAYKREENQEEVGEISIKSGENCGWVASVQSNGWLGPVKGLRHHASHLFSFIEVFLKHWLRWALRC